jgi:hypothetical protein
MGVLAQSHLALDPISSYCQVFVFPNSNDLPSRSLQCEVGLLIALDVLGELLDPPLPVGLSLDPPIGSLGLRAVRCLTGSA